MYVYICMYDMCMYVNTNELHTYVYMYLCMCTSMHVSIDPFTIYFVAFHKENNVSVLNPPDVAGVRSRTLQSPAAGRVCYTVENTENVSSNIFNGKYYISIYLKMFASI